MARTIEQELQQTRFQSEAHRFILNILVTANRLDLLNTQAMRPFGITPPQFNVLRILRGRHPDGIHICDITERMIDKSSNASRLVDKLEDKKLALRIPSPQDRRAVEITITEKGLALLSEIDRVMDGHSRIYNDLDPADLQRAGKLLDDIRQRTPVHSSGPVSSKNR